MRFLTVTQFVSIVGATDLVCSEDIVRTAEIQGFISTIYNCVYDHDTSIGSQACLAAFIDANTTDNAFPITGACRDAYQALVDGIYTNITSADMTNVLLCPETSLEFGAIPSSYECVNVLITELEDFKTDTGFYPFSMCSGSQVRSVNIIKPFAFTRIVDSAWNDANLYWIFPEPHPACEYCYWYDFHDPLSSNNPSDNIVEACSVADGPTDLCLTTTVIIKHREAFLLCAGYDILTVGGMCTAEGIDAVESMIPAPYYTFAQCAYNPQTAFCAATEAYLDEIEADTSSVDCLACYTELQSDLIALAADDADEVCGEDLYSDDCLAYQADALTAFETCSGFTLNTVSATVAPSVTTTAPITDTTADATRTAVPTTTVASATTKAASYLSVTMLVGVAFAVGI